MKYIVKEYIAVPGLHRWVDAEVIVVNNDNVDAAIATETRMAHFHGEQIIGFRVYEEAYRAHDLVNEIRADKAVKLAQWRHEVYGEPIPVAS